MAGLVPAIHVVVAINTSVDCHDLVECYGKTVVNLFIYAQ